MITKNGFRENKIAKALYVIEVDGEIMAMLITHVDDLCWAAKPRFEKNMTRSWKPLSSRKLSLASSDSAERKLSSSRISALRLRAKTPQNKLD